MEKLVKKTKYEKIQEGIVNKPLNFFKLKNTNSQISCHSKPTKKEIKYIRDTYGVNYILTLFYEKEKPEEIQKICEEFGIKWKWIELEGANYFKKTENFEKILREVLDIYKSLQNEETTLYVHCALGIHRTGTIIYTLLRLFNETPESALEALEFIRKETREKVGDHRIEKAEKILVPAIQNILDNENNDNEENNI